MKTTHAVAHASEPIRSHGLLKRILYWILDLDDEATLEEGRRRMWSRAGFSPPPTPEQLEMIRRYDGSEHLGLPLTSGITPSFSKSGHEHAG